MEGSESPQKGGTLSPPPYFFRTQASTQRVNAPSIIGSDPKHNPPSDLHLTLRYSLQNSCTCYYAAQHAGVRGGGREPHPATLSPTQDALSSIFTQTPRVLHSTQHAHPEHPERLIFLCIAQTERLGAVEDARL